ncbi:MAG TPA: OmpA family protein, partial [candidate division Zixibacteria bacterium]|nr:OmpA family protein [candidate division Zixibacteria bacterium]
DEPMVLNIDYPSGSFEIDPSSQERLRSLARALLVAPNVRLEINGYTDNIGTDEANRSLSEKRANRVRDFLAAQGVAESRMSVNGRGETGFVASNETAEGRALNRRIEIVFYK